ncbi:MAG: hypothetical protein ACP5MH_11925, partial [Thermoproteus sp.]
MALKKVIFKGKNVEVWYTEAAIEQLIKAEGLEIRGDGFYKHGKKIVISRRPFRALWPQLRGDLAGGSVCWVREHKVASNWHVAAYTNTLYVTQNESYPVTWREMYRPTVYNPLEFLVRYYIGRWFGLGPRYSKYDYAVGDVATDYETQWPAPVLIFFAGNCTSRGDTNCVGLALPRPDAADPGDSVVGKKYSMYCT